MNISSIDENHLPIQVGAHETNTSEELPVREEIVDPKNDLPSIFEVQKQIAVQGPDFYEAIKLCRANPDGYPPVAYAVKIGRHDVAKFLIDHNEPANAALASYDVYREAILERTNGTDYVTTRLLGIQPGYTPLELAIRQNDHEMVKILLTHNPANYADTNIITRRFYDEFLYREPQNLEDGHGYWSKGVVITKIADGHPYGGWQVGYILRIGGPLAEALAGDNKEIIESIIKSYKTEEPILNAYEQIQATKKEYIMRLWLEQKLYVMTGEYPVVTDATVKMYLDSSLQNAVVARDIILVEQFLLQPTSKKELENASRKAYEIGAYEILELIEAKMK